jgi:hypothetical protein
MAVQTLRPIYDTLARIQNFTIHPYKEGQVYFASENNQLFVDIDGQRAAQAQLSSIGVLDGVNEIYEKGVKGFEGQILTAKTSNGYRLFYVDNDAQVHNLTFTAEDLGSITEDGFQGGALQYNGVWATNKTYFADELRTSVVKEGNNFYYATETHTSGTFATDLTAEKWIKFSIQFTSVATSLLLAEDAVITKTLVIGTEGTDVGTIRSTNATALNDGIGFFMSNTSDGVFRIGNPGGNFIRWDGSSLTINGTISATNVTGLGSLATQNSVDYGSQVTGTKPPANADATSTVIAGGLITTGTLQVTQGGTVAAGITGNTSGDTAVRFFAGSSFENRASAPFRVLQNGSMSATSGTIGKLNILPNVIAFNDLVIVQDIINNSPASFLLTDNSSIRSNGDWSPPGQKLLSNQFLSVLEKGGLGIYKGRGTGTTGGIQLTTDQFTGYLSTTGSTSLDIDASSIYLKYRTGGGAFVTRPSDGSNFFISTTGGNISSKIIKTDIEDITEEEIYNFIEKVEVKKYFNLMNNNQEISIIIEDEENNKNPFISLISEQNINVSFNNNLPNYLKSYENDSNIIKVVDKGDNKIYNASIKSLKLKEYISATLASTKLNHNRIKELESENEQLKARLDAIEAKLKD